MLNQDLLYEEMVRFSSHKYEKENERAKKYNAEYSTTYGSRLCSMYFDKCLNEIEEWLKEQKETKKQKVSSYEYVRMLPPEVSVGVLFTAVFGRLSEKRTLNSVYHTIGRMFEDEFLFRTLKESEPYLAAYKEGELKQLNNTSRDTHLNILKLLDNLDIPYTRISQKNRVLVGATLFNLFQPIFTVKKKDGKFLPLLEVTTEVTRKKHKLRKLLMLECTRELENIIDRTNSFSQYFTPRFLPMVETPKRWVTAKGGGYDFTKEHFRLLNLVKNKSRFYQDRLLTETGAYKDFNNYIYPVTNKLQDVKWKVNTKVLDVLNEIIEKELDKTFNLPVVADNSTFPAKLPEGAGEEELKKWKKQAHEWYKGKNKHKGQRVRLVNLRNLANKYKEEDAMYFPMFLDFRGRIYTKPQLLTPQGDDLAKSLLHFSEGKAIGTQEAIDWLAVHGANVYGVKGTLKARRQWVSSCVDKIRECAMDPVEYRWWLEADNPWQFLAFCFEWESVVTRGTAHVTRLPVYMDGSNNGLQILSLLAQDTVGCARTNCDSIEEPQDIYQMVADDVVNTLMEDFRDKPDHETLPERATSNINPVDTIKSMAKYLVSVGIDRKTVKRQVMVLPYNGTFMSTMTYTKEWLRDKFIAEEAGVTFRDTHLYLSAVIDASMKKYLGKAKEVMEWLCTCSQVVSSVNKEIMWKTPCDFLVHQQYFKTEPQYFELATGQKVRRKRKRLVTNVETEDVSKHKMKNAIAPNFVHSLDSACLFIAVHNMMKFDLKSVSVVHDSFGTYATDIDVMHSCIRKAYYDVFKEDQLEVFREQILKQLPEKYHEKVPSCPKKGEFNLEKILDSTYMFS